jgi:hypothetical protein
VEENRVKVLNVAGPRTSKEPDIGEFVMVVLGAVFGDATLDRPLSF